MNLTAEVQSAPADADITYQWTIPGTVAHDWIHDNQESFDWPLGDAQKTLQSINFAWIDGGSSRQVSVAVMVNGVTIPSVTATFDVTKPDYGLTIAKGDGIRIFFNSDGTVGNVQDGDNNIPGVSMSMTDVPESDQANCNIWQIVTGSVIRMNTTSGWVHGSMTGDEYTLDTSDPYGLNYSPTSAQDSPAILGFSTAATSEIYDASSFSDFLMYKPPGAEHTSSIWVPLSTANWNWAADVVKLGTDWTLASSTLPSNATGSSTTSYPGGLGWFENIANDTLVNGYE